MGSPKNIRARTGRLAEERLATAAPRGAHPRDRPGLVKGGVHKTVLLLGVSSWTDKPDRAT
eukprot:8101007-Alexandrium_andersonii.AAC.1